MKKILLICFSAIFLLTGCATAAPLDQSGAAPLEPTIPAAVKTETVKTVYFDSIELLTMESAPVQFLITLKGKLPTPCHKLQIEANPPDAQNNIVVNVSAAANPEEICAQVLAPFEENFSLGSFPAGHYFLWVNGDLVAEFDA